MASGMAWEMENEASHLNVPTTPNRASATLRAHRPSAPSDAPRTAVRPGAVAMRPGSSHATHSSMMGTTRHLSGLPVPASAKAPAAVQHQQHQQLLQAPQQQLQQTMRAPGTPGGMKSSAAALSMLESRFDDLIRELDAEREHRAMLERELQAEVVARQALEKRLGELEAMVRRAAL
eukprot:m51a1_g3264 hypothetical protein (177) ;mRNA; f:198733-200499